MHGVGGQPDVRVRPAEFDSEESLTAAQLLAKLRAAVTEAVTIIEAVPPSRFVERISPQGTDVSVLAAIYQVVQHFAGHTFQIIYATKHLTKEDLGFSARWNNPTTSKDRSR